MLTTHAPVTQLRRPAYARRLLDMRRAGLAPTAAALLVDGWAETESLDEFGPWIVIVPDGERAAEFDFGCFSGLFVVVMAETLERVDELTAQVLKFHPLQVFGWPEDVQRLAVLASEAA